MSIYKKLLAVQREVGAISKDSKNPFFKSKYFDINKLIEVVSPVLSKNGLVLLQPIIDGKVFSKIFDSESGESVESCIDLPNLTDPQKLGSEHAMSWNYSKEKQYRDLWTHFRNEIDKAMDGVNNGR